MPDESQRFQADLLNQLHVANPGRTICPLPDSAWGNYITPAPDETRNRANESLRVVVFGSWTLGMLAFEAARELETLHPDKVNIVGLVTDNPLNPGARISKQKRFWRYYGPSKQEMYVLDLMEEALTHGVPCYTGEIKNDPFRACLADWQPDAIVVSGFGQLIDTPIITLPKYGIYNVHPADLLHGFGAGAQPWEDLIERKAETTRLTIHQVTEKIDSGSVVGFSPPLNVRLAQGKCSDDACLIGEKTFIPVKRMVGELVTQLHRAKQSNTQKPIDSLDFHACFSPAACDRLMQPVDPNQRGHILPLTPQHSKDTV